MPNISKRKVVDIRAEIVKLSTKTTESLMKLRKTHIEWTKMDRYHSIIQIIKLLTIEDNVADITEYHLNKWG